MSSHQYHAQDEPKKSKAMRKRSSEADPKPVTNESSGGPAHLQRTLGNRAVEQLAGNSPAAEEQGKSDSAQASLQGILHHSQQAARRSGSDVVQPKLMLGPVGDKYEQEADSVAKQVVGTVSSQGQPGTQRQEMEEEELMTKPDVQRQEMEEEELMMKPDVQRQEMEEEELMMKPDVQRQEMEEEVMAKPDGQRQELASTTEARIQQARGGGRPLPDEVRAPLEESFGADFSGVKVHTDETADDLNLSLQARAFTTGQDIFFKEGEYSPAGSSGQELLAHELTHVIQQSGGDLQRDAEEAASAKTEAENSEHKDEETAV